MSYTSLRHLSSKKGFQPVIMHKILASPRLMGLVSRIQRGLAFPSHGLKTRQLLYALTHSEIVPFKNLTPLNTLNRQHFPVLPEGHFWHFTGTDWSIRRLHNAPKALLDLDIYSRAGNPAKPAAAYTVSQNKQLVAVYVNTTLVDGVPTSRKATPSTYGGFSSSKKDFRNCSTQYSDTIGHAVAHKDSSRGRNKDGEPIYSDSNPRNYSPEKSHATGGSTWGQSIRNHQLESLTRKKKGEYLEWNPYGNTHEQVKIGLYVPSQKISMRIINLQESLAVFNQNLPIVGSKTADVWQAHVVNTSKRPRPSILDESFPLTDEAFSLGPLFLARSSEKLVMQCDTEFEVGRSVTLDNGDIAIIISKTPHAGGFQYEYHAYYQAFHYPVAVYLSMGGIYDKLLAEYDELDQGYRDRFSPILKGIGQLDTLLSDLLKLSGERKMETLRFVREALRSSSDHRQTDAKEILEFILKEVKSIRESYDELVLLVLNHAVNRLDVIDALNPAFIQLIQDMHQDGMTDKRLEEEIYRNLAGVAHDFKKQDLKLCSAFDQKAHEIMISIRSLMGVLHPPKVVQTI